MWMHCSSPKDIILDEVFIASPVWKHDLVLLSFINIIRVIYYYTNFYNTLLTLKFQYFKK